MTGTTDNSGADIATTLERYASGSAGVADVLQALADAHRDREAERTHSTDDVVPGTDESWYGLSRRSDSEFGGSDARRVLMEAYGPFAQQQGWVVRPVAGYCDFQNPDNPFFARNAQHRWTLQQEIAILYGVGLASAEDVIDAHWVCLHLGMDPDTTRNHLVPFGPITTLHATNQLTKDQYAELQTLYLVQKRRRRRRPALPRIYYASDVDGVRWGIVDPDEKDMAGWQVLSGQGCILRHEDWTLRTARASQPDDSYLAYPLSEAPVLAWMAPMDPEDYLVLLDPNGRDRPV